MSIYLGRVDVAQSNYAWLEPLASTDNSEHGWKQKVFAEEFPDRGAVHVPKGYAEGVYDHTVWVFEIQENHRYEPNKGGAKYTAVNLRSAYFLQDLPSLTDQEALRSALLLGFSVQYIAAAERMHWLMKTANGMAVYFTPGQLEFEKRSDGRLTVKLSRMDLIDAFDVKAFDLTNYSAKYVQPEYFDPAWLPVKAETYCWDSDIRFLARVVNRLPKLKRRCEQLGISLSQASEISKTKAREAINLLEEISPTSGSIDLDRPMLNRLGLVLQKVDNNQNLLNQLFSMVYDNEALKTHLRNEEKNYINRRRIELENELAVEHEKLEEAKAQLYKAIFNRNAAVNEMNEAKMRHEELQAEGERSLSERKELLEKEFLRFRDDLQIQATAIKEQFSSKLAESLMQTQLLQLVCGSAQMPDQIQQPVHQHNINAPSIMASEVTGADVGVSSEQEWNASLTKCSKSHCLNEDALVITDIVSRSREIPWLWGPASAWLAQCYASLFGTKRILRYTPGPTTLGLDDLFYRGGTSAPTQMQLFMEKAAQQPSLAHIVMLEQIYCEQAHFWLPSLARELRLGSRIPDNVLLLICASSSIDKLDITIRESVWFIECQQEVVSKAGIVVEPQSQSDKSRGLDSNLVAPGTPYMLGTNNTFSTFENQLRNTHGNNPEIWSRFSRLMLTAAYMDDQCLTKVGEHLIQHLQKTS